MNINILICAILAILLFLTMTTQAMIIILGFLLVCLLFLVIEDKIKNTWLKKKQKEYFEILRGKK